MRTYIFTIVLLSAWQYGISQTNGNSDLDSLLKTIRSGYAGYPDKGQTKEFGQLVDAIKMSSSKDTFALLSRITTWFGDLHLILYDYDIRNHVDSMRAKADYAAVTAYLADPATKKDAYEGYWRSELGNCIMALRKTTSRPLAYQGFIAETSTRAPRGFCLMILQQEAGGAYFTDYREENLEYRVFLRSKFKAPDILLVNSYGKWRKIPRYTAGMLKGSTPFGYTPEIKRLDDKTVWIKLPDFSRRNIKVTDSLVKANADMLAHTEHLIVDVRNNMGGTINNYTPLLPYVCDKDIVRPGVDKLCSDELISDIKNDIDYYNKNNDTARAKRSALSLQRVTASRGKYLRSAADTEKCTGIMPMPRHVSVLVNNMCLSATELMLLDFKQSGKVKLFGETSGGAVDYLDALSLVLPSGRYTLFMATTRRVPAAAGPGREKLDGRGIQPDVVIPESEPDWLTFVKRYYEKQ